MFALPGASASPAAPLLDDFSFGEALSEPSLALDDALANEAQRAVVRGFAERVPLSWHWGMFEVRLQAGPSDVDLLGCLLPSGVSTLDMHEGHGALAATTAMLQAWRGGNGPLGRVQSVWYEWDRASEARAPLLWLCVDPFFFGASSEVAAPDHVEQTIGAFFGESTEYAVSGAAALSRRVAEALPEQARIVAAASLKPRGVDALRLYVRLPRLSLARFLERIGWPGDRLRADSYKDIANPRFEWCYCQIELDRELRPYLALELGQSERHFPERTSRRRWFERMVGDGLADRARVEAVMAWAGESRASSRLHTTIVRTIHTKLVLADRRAPEAKAYLGFHYLRER